MKYWLMKTEPAVFALSDLMQAKNQESPWEGVRNYQARNFMRDEMKTGDKVLFYHSSCEIPGIVGIAVISRPAEDDLSALNPKSTYFDPKATKENPRWVQVWVKFEKKFNTILALEMIKKHKMLNEMFVAKRGQRLSIQPVTQEHYEICCHLGLT